MRMISELLNNLKNAAEDAEDAEDCLNCSVYAYIMRQAANTIEELSAKLANANMERSTAYYNDGWIPVSERLPNTEHISGVSETVLVTTNNNSIFTAEYHINGKWLDDVADWSLDVIAWQPLPAPYQPKGE